MTLHAVSDGPTSVLCFYSAIVHLRNNVEKIISKPDITMSGKHSLKLWAFEIAFLSVSIFSVAAIGGCCVFYNGKQIVKSRLPITLNVIVSALSTLSAASLMTVVESCISQGNWILFSDSPRRLYDFEIIAEASRGPWGSFRILLSRSVRGA